MTTYLILTIAALWVIGMIPSFMVVTEIGDADTSIAILWTIIWPFGVVFLVCVSVLFWIADKIKAWWKAPLPPKEPEIDPEEG